MKAQEKEINPIEGWTGALLQDLPVESCDLWAVFGDTLHRPCAPLRILHPSCSLGIQAPRLLRVLAPAVLPLRVRLEPCS